MRTTPLSKKELTICRRLRTAREFLGITQDECAEQLDIERSTFANYERGRVPVRTSLALRFCRQFIISEEWLATGLHHACHDAAKLAGVGWNDVMDMKIFRRQCMDLFSEPEAMRITPQTLFSEAYAGVLGPIYARLIKLFFYNPKINLHESDNEQIGINLLTAINERHVLLLDQLAKAMRKPPSEVTRTYFRCVFQASDLIARKLSGKDLTVEFLESFDWLRAAVTQLDVKIGPLFVEAKPEKQESARVAKAPALKS